MAHTSKIATTDVMQLTGLQTAGPPFEIKTTTKSPSPLTPPPSPPPPPPPPIPTSQTPPSQTPPPPAPQKQSSKKHLSFSLKRVSKRCFHSHSVEGTYLNYSPVCFVRAAPTERGSWDMKQFWKVG